MRCFVLFCLACFQLVARSIAQERIIYNRAPKCGSSTMRALLYELEKENHVKGAHITTCDHCINGQQRTQRKFFDAYDDLVNTTQDFYIVGHARWLDFSVTGRIQPSYINILRHPVLRHRSEYYYFRSRKGELHSKERAKEECSCYKKKFSDCILNSSPECSESVLRFAGVYTSYFCGYNCDNMTDISKNERIFRNFDSYAFVGVTEDMKSSVFLLGKTFPHIFRNADAIYAKIDPVKLQEYTFDLSEQVAQKLLNFNKGSVELELYYRALNRVIESMSSIRLRPNLVFRNTSPGATQLILKYFQTWKDKVGR